VKLLLDENLSRRIVQALEATFPGSTQVALVGLQRASDAEVWQYAKDHEFVIVSKDEDFVAMANLIGQPPRLMKLSLGNCSNEHVWSALSRQHALIESAFADPAVAMVELVPL
jgi:predicted nuclease of predicted toxin-antitoxin system